MNETPNNQNDDFSQPPPPRDELDGLLREWHATNAARAAAGRDRLLEALGQEDARAATGVVGRIELKAETIAPRRPLTMIRRIIVNRYAPLAAAAVIAAVVLPFVLPGKTGFVSETKADSSNVVMAPDGGRLDAFDREGNLLGPCALKHTDVKAEISGRFTRVTVTQQYKNTNPDKIEAVYTFPLSDRAGVDRMSMTIGDRVIVGEVKERQQARRIYEQAKAADRVASLLEQERPNIFTQSVANIEPGATIDISISYVEMVTEHDGEFSFAFPTVVSPRYIPGSGDYRSEQPRGLGALPEGVQPRRGVVLMGPASVRVTGRGPGIARSDAGVDDRLLNGALAAAIPVVPPADADADNAYFAIQASYADGSRESGVYRRDGLGRIGGRWFFCPPPQRPVEPQDPAKPGDNFAQPTNQVPDADRITPMPTRPGVRAGHDISISVTMDTGGPGITTLESEQHKVERTDLARNTMDQPRRVSIALASLAEIPNRDFVLKWKQTSETISSRVFTHTGDTGNFFTVQLDPPAANNDARAVPRELVFVVDTSGSMNGRPISLCQEVMRKAIDQMRPQDTFNIITFAGATRIMWDRPRPSTPENREEAQRFIATWQGQGGTEMMTAIEAALRQGPVMGGLDALTPAQLADLPADGRQVVVEADDSEFRSEGLTKDAVTDRAELYIRDTLSIKCTPFALPDRYLKRATQTVADESVTLKLLMRGTWMTVNGERVFQVASAEVSRDSGVRPLRIVMFLTDAEVGNDFAIIDAIKRNRATTRVFSFGIGSSVNRYLIEQMAIAGGGEPEFIYANAASEQQATDAIERFNRRTKTPILSDIHVTFNGVQPLDVLPDPTTVQDLWDNRPLTFMGRYAAAASGTLTIKGQTSRGPWERTIPIDLPARQAENSSLPTLWARAKIDALTGSDLLGVQHGQPNPEVRAKIITLGETFNVMSQYTSFVAVDKLRVTIEGRPRLVHVPVELPDQTNWKGFFGELPNVGEDEQPARAAGDAGNRPALKLQASVVDQLVAANRQMAKDREAAETTRDLDGKRGMVDKLATVAPPAPALTPAPAAAAPATPAIPAPSAAAKPGSGRGPAGESAKRQSNIGRGPDSTVAEKGDAPTPQVPGGQLGGGGPQSLRTDLKKEADRSVPQPVPLESAPSPVATPMDARSADDFIAAPAQPLDGAGATHAPHEGIALLGDLPIVGLQQQTEKQLASSTGLGSVASGQYLGYPAMDAITARLALSGKVSAEDASRYLNAYRDAQPGIGNFAFSAVAGRDDSFGRAGLERGPGNTAVANVVLLAAAQLAEAGRVDDAKALLCDGTVPPADAPTGGASAPATPAEQLCGVLNSSATETERAAAIRAAYTAASGELMARRRFSVLMRRLAPDVFIQTPTGARSAEPSTASGVATPTKPVASLYVTILLADTTDKTLNALKALGIKIEAVRAEASVVVARVPIEKLEALGLMEAVRRVELVPGEGDAVR